ncbi:hypothetical protein DL98DRAFT_514958 [Cadophora sp. DSE1049]|nr:hypothetical protein DL98DRAFT_514958 [Cadophora sp. DSE1049]
MATVQTAASPTTRVWIRLLVTKSQPRQLANPTIVVSSHTDYETSMASPPSADYDNNEYSVQTTAWQPRTREISYSFDSGSDDFVCGSCAQRFRRRADLERHERTIHVNKASRPYKCEVLGCPAGVTSWAKLEKLQAHNEEWHGGNFALASSNKEEELYYTEPHNYSSSTRHTTATGEPPGFAATQGLSELHSGFAQMSLGRGSNFASSSETKFAGRAASTHVMSKNPTTSKEEFDPHYKVHKAYEFKWGRVFKVLWSEPLGSDDKVSGDETDTDVEEGRGKLGAKSFSKVRRFVIIKPMAGHCICLPILTYAGKGVTKTGVHAQHHAPMFNKGGKVVYAKGEREKGLTRNPIEFEPASPRHKLDGISRLNYAKAYTVEYNVKVWFIGRIARESEWYLATDFNRTHPPLEVRSRPADDPETRTVWSSNTSHPEVLYDDDAASSPQTYSASSSWQQYQPQYQTSPTRMRRDTDTTGDEGRGDEEPEEDLYSAA